MLEPGLNDSPASESEDPAASTPFPTCYNQSSEAPDWEPNSDLTPAGSEFNFRRCLQQITPTHRCNAPALHGELFCRHHYRATPAVSAPPRMPFELPCITDRDSARAFAAEIASRVAANSLDVHRARALLSSLRVILATLPPLPRPQRENTGEAALKPPTKSSEVEIWARMFLARAEAARTGAPDPFDMPITYPLYGTPANPAEQPSAPAPSAAQPEQQPRPDCSSIACPAPLGITVPEPARVTGSR